MEEVEKWNKWKSEVKKVGSESALETLGLRLMPQVGTVNVLVIDAVERPSSQD